METLIKLDHELFLLINGGGQPWLDVIFTELSSLASWPVAIIAFATLGVKGQKSFWKHFLVLVVVGILAFGSKKAIQRTFPRARPVPVLGEKVRHIDLWNPKRSSFPSGHSMFAFYVLVYASCYRRSYRYWFMVLASACAYSRIYVGLHFPADCAVGSAMGIGWGYLAWLAHERFLPDKKRPKDDDNSATAEKAKESPVPA